MLFLLLCYFCYSYYPQRLSSTKKTEARLVVNNVFSQVTPLRQQFPHPSPFDHAARHEAGTEVHSAEDAVGEEGAPTDPENALAFPLPRSLGQESSWSTFREVVRFLLLICYTFPNFEWL